MGDEAREGLAGEQIVLAAEATVRGMGGYGQGFTEEPSF